MVGIVLISHSRPLAEAVLGLVRQMASPQVQIAIAAGVGEQREEFGTDAVEVMEAVQSVYSEAGVLVLMDLGSAILSADMARELLPPEIAANLRFCSAPLVEGAITAAVQAGLGASLDDVCREARQALLPKQEQLGQALETLEVAAPAVADPGLPGAGAQELVLELKNPHGLHARPAARFVQMAGSFDAEIQVRNLTRQKGPVSARSLNAIAILGAVGGHRIAISARGPQATQALEALQQLVEDRFGEGDETALPAAVPEAIPASRPAARLVAGEALPATPVSEGVALGPLFVYQAALPPISDAPAADAHLELHRLDKALAETALGIRFQRDRLVSSGSASEAAILDAHLLILQDPELQAQVRGLITAQRYNAAHAWDTAIQETAAGYRALEDAYLQQRAADVLDVGRQVLFALAGQSSALKIALPEPVVLYAADLTPSETLQLDLERVLAVLTTGGGPTSHAAILARSLGIPALSGVNPALAALPNGALLAVDGFEGKFWLDPPAEVRTAIAARRLAWQERRAELLLRSSAQAHTADGVRVEVAANIGSLVDARAAERNGAEGVGLLRTEFLYLTRQTPPSEQEQYDALCEISAVLGSRPVIVRTLDAGGDKELPYAGLPAEANPFLGVRAIRLCLQKLDLFVPQLRAILRAGLHANLRIMFPMVANLAEVLQVKQVLQQVHEALLAEGIQHRWPISTGIMVEIPAAALLSDAIAPEVDFFSVGTNDLTQYTLAAERGNPALSHLADGLHPAVLRLIGQVCAAARAHGKWVGVCGELAGDPAAAPVLVGLGVSELSLNPGGIPRIKNLLSRVRLPEMQALAAEILQMTGAVEARQRARAFLMAAEGN